MDQKPQAGLSLACICCSPGKVILYPSFPLGNQLLELNIITLEPLIASNCYNHLLGVVLFITLFFLSTLLVCGTHYLPTLFLVVALVLLKINLGLFTLFRCLILSVCLLVCLFFAIFLSKSLILAFGYGTDCTFIYMIMVSFT